MPKMMTGNEAAVRRAKILTAARWCFLNFGFAKTALEDIAKRANLSRTLLYRIFKDKEEIFQAVFVDWLVFPAPCCEAGGEGACQSLRTLAQRVPVDGARALGRNGRHAHGERVLGDL